MPLHVTSLIAGLLALLMVPLSFQISVRRVQLRTVFGDAEDETLRRRVRAHGNFAEYAPLGLIVLGLVEWSGASSGWVWALGILLLGSRLLHLTGMLYAESPLPRALAMVVQHAAFVGAGLWLVGRSL